MNLAGPLPEEGVELWPPSATRLIEATSELFNRLDGES
jgi:hypothetical protein